MQFDQTGKPVSSTTRSTWRDDFPFFVFLILGAAGLYLISVAYREDLEPIPTGTADATPVIIVQSDPLPPEVLAAAVALATEFAPVPTKPPATPIPVCDTPVPYQTCYKEREVDTKGTVIGTPVPWESHNSN
jgi:hypothetical protein